MKNKTKMTALILTLSTLSAVQAVESMNKVVTNEIANARPNLNKIELDLSKNNLGDKKVKGLFSELPKSLLALNLSRNNIGDLGAIGLFTNLPESLLALNIGGNHISPVGAGALGVRCIEPLSLQRLDMSRNNIGDKGVMSIYGSELLKNLQALGLAYNGITDKGLLSLCQEIVMRNPSLKELNLGGNNIGDEGVKGLVMALAHGRHNRCLESMETLDLSENDIGYEGFKDLFEILPEMIRLQELNIGGNNITDKNLEGLFKTLPKSVKKIIGSGGELNLDGNTILDLSRSNLGNDKVIGLVNNIRTENLQELNLSGNNIGDKGAEVLADNLPESLQALGLAYNGITAKGSSELFKELEARKINLKKLNISGNRLHSSGHAAGDAFYHTHHMLLQSSSSLEELDMHDVDLVGEGGYLLSALQGSRILKKVNISKCGITGDNAIPILRILATTAIEDLNISRNNFDYPAFLLTEMQGFLDFCSQLSEMENLKIFDVSHGCLVTTQLIEIIQNLPESIQVLCMNNNEPRKDWNERLTLLRQIYDRFPGLDCRNLMHNHTRTNAEILILRLSEKDNLKTVYAGNVSGDSYWRGWDLNPEQKAEERDLDRDFNDDFKKTLSKELPGVEVK